MGATAASCGPTSDPRAVDRTKRHQIRKADVPAANLRSQFLHVLRSRRPSEVPLSVIPGKLVKDPLFQESPKPNFSEAMALCPKEDIPNFKELLQEENFCLTTEVWDRIAPGLASQFDAPYTVTTIVPLPLLILNGEDDPRCPLGGVEIPESRACKAYEEANCPQNFKMFLPLNRRVGEG